MWVGREGTTGNLIVEVIRGTTGSRCIYTNGISEGVLTRYTAVVNGSTCRIFKDAGSTPSYSTSFTALPVSGLTWIDNFIGKSNWSADEQYEGKIRSLRIYASAFTPSQIDSFNYKTLTFNVNSGTATGITSGVTSGKMKLATAPSRTGYTFNGWYDSISGGNLIGLGGVDYTPNATGTLYAQWSGNKYSYNANTGSNPPSDQTYAGSTLTAASGASVSAPAGYTFNGWCTTQPSVGSACSGTRYDSGDNLPIPQSPTVSLFAIWQFTSLETSGDTHVVSGTNGNTNYGSGTTLLLKNASNTTANAFNRSVFLKFEFDPSIDWTGVALEVYVAANNSGGSTRWNTSYTTFNVNVYASNDSNWTESGITFNNANSSTDSWGINTATWPWSLDSNDLLGTISIPTSESTVGQKFALSNSDLANFLNNDPDGKVTLYLVRGDTDPGSNLAFHSRESTTLAGPTISIPSSGYSYTIAYDINGGSGSLPAAGTFTNGGLAYTIANGTSITPPAGKVFSKWNSRADGSGTDYAAGASYSTSSSITLYAQWTNTDVTATFKSNYSGGASDVTQTISSNTATTLTSNSFTRVGYTFAGWNTLANGTGTNYTNGQTVTLTTSLTLYAKWTANSNTVTFNSNYGTPTTSTQQITTDVSTALTANSFSRTGYTFTGWNTAANGSGTDYSNSQSVTINGSLTLYARWSANSNTVTFNSNYGTPTTSTQTITSGSATALTSNSFTRNGYSFAGWNTLAGGGGTSYTDGQSVTIYAPFTLYAQWTEIRYTVMYDKNGASGSPEKSSEVYGISTGALSLSTAGSMTKTGYTFDGWYTAASGGSKIGNASATYTPSADITLYARWNAASYSVTFNSTGSTSGSAPSTLTYTTGGSAVTIPNEGTLAKTGYTFSKWNTRADGLGTDYAIGASLTTSAPVALYPNWTAISYTITYSDQNKTSGNAPVDSNVYNIGDTAYIKANTSLVRTGYTFAGWTISQNNLGTVNQSGDSYTFGAGSITLYPKWTANTYNITYNANGATGTPARSSDTYTSGDSGISLPNNSNADMVKPGFTFAGWSTTPTGTVLSGSSATSFTTSSDVTLYAIWNKKSITYQYNRGAINAVDMTGSEVATFPGSGTTTVYFNDSVTFSSNISSTINYGGNSYKFFGWTDGNTTYQPGNTFSIDTNVIDSSPPITFRAQWIQIFNVRYALNGGTGVVDVDDQCDPVTHVCTDGQSIQLNAAPTRVGYDFAGWQDLSGTSRAAGSTMEVRSTNYLLYAQWTPVDYSITFDSIGGSNSPAAQTKNIGQTVTLPSPGSRTGYDFSGWTVGGVTYGVGTTYTVGSTNAAFTALWTAKRFNVSYDWNGGVGTPTPSSIYTYGNAAITLPTGSSHTKDGYVFNGWKDQDGNSIGSTHTPTQDTRYVAQWIDGSYTLTYNAAGGSLAQSSVSVSRTASTTLPTPTRTNYTFDGWYEDSGNTVLYGQAAASVTPVASRTLYAKWVQDSLSGINPAHLNSLTTITTQTGNASAWTGSHSLSGTGASLTIPADALPNGTVAQVSFVEDLTRPKNLINNTYAYYTSVVLHWQLGTGSSATVPVAAAGKPLVLTLTNPDIRAGAKIYKIIRGEAREVATATQDGQVTINVYEDPEIVVAATTPTAPLSVTALGNLNAQSTVSWTAPTSSGGAEVTSYTVTSSPGNQTCTATGTTSCTVSGLTNNTTYTFTVVANNAVGSSVASAASAGIIPRLLPTFNATFDSKGGSSVSDTLFNNTDGIAEPSAPTRNGYTFGGWLSTDGDTSTLITFPYSPNVNSDVTLYAYWTSNAVNTGGGTNSGVPTVSPIINAPATSPIEPNTRTPLINMPAAPTPISAPVSKFPELQNAPYPTNGLNVPAIGEIVALVNREPVQLTVTPKQTQTLIEFGTDLAVTLTAQNQAGQSIEVAPSGALTVIKGAFVSAAGEGFKPNSPIEAWLYSTPIRLGSGYADETGAFANNFAIGSQIPLGKHTLVLNGLTNDGEIATLALGVQVVEQIPAEVQPDSEDGSNLLVRIMQVVLAIALLLMLRWLIRRPRKH